MKHSRVLFWLILVYVLSRAYIWVAKPVDFSQITTVYMPYAHLWASGVTPYLEQWYEYPPATIPLFYLPHLIDQATRHWLFHINYGTAYRGLILFVDVGLFWIIYTVLHIRRVPYRVMAGSLIFYILATMKAHDFIYDSMDLVFVGAIVLGLSAPVLVKGFWGRVLGWIGYFLAVGFKLINAPLGLVYAVSKRKQPIKLIIPMVLAGLLIWSVPLFIFRSSLSVMLAYHAQRGLQVESVPAQIAAVINRFSGTESYENKYQSMNIIGPVSDSLTTIFNYLFLIALLAYIFWSSKQVLNLSDNRRFEANTSLTMGYLFCFMLFGKVLSTPYHLWYIPLVALFPFRSLTRQLRFTLPVFFMIVISMTNIPNVELGWLTLHLVIGIVRSMLIFWLFWQSIKLSNEVV